MLSKSKSLEKNDRQPTRGFGDCAYHAIFGEWEVISGEFVCRDVKDKRTQVAEAIEKCLQTDHDRQPKDKLYPLVREAIQQLVIISEVESPGFDEARIVYQEYIVNNQARIVGAWQNFEQELLKNPIICEFIDQSISPEKAAKTLHEKYHTCLTGEHSEELVLKIFSIRSLYEAKQNYDTESLSEFKLDDLIKESDLLKEYASLMRRHHSDRTNGYWLLPGELMIVAKIFNLTIKLYQRNATGNLAVVESYEGGNSRACDVFFNGINHYEKIDKRHKSKAAAKKTDVALKGEGTYESSGLKRALHGTVYQLKLLMLFLMRALENQYEFDLATEKEDAEKFDDVVFRYKPKRRGGWKYRYLQAKHKYDESSVIKVADLLSDYDGDFSLKKYFISYQRIVGRLKKNDKDISTIEDFVLCTNIGFDAKSQPDHAFQINEAFDEVKDFDSVLSSNNYPNAKRYRFKRAFTGRDKLVKVLKHSDLLDLAKKIKSCLASDKESLDLRSPLVKFYHVALVSENVIDRNRKGLSHAFINNEECLSNNAREFRGILFDLYKEENSLVTEKAIQKQLVLKKLKFSKKFGERKENEESPSMLPSVPTQNDIDDFLNNLTFAVHQPNVDELSVCLENGLCQRFNLIQSDLVAGYFQSAMLGWLKAKHATFLSRRGAEQFFGEADSKINQLVMMGPTLEYVSMLQHFDLGFRSKLGLVKFLGSKQKILHCYSQSDLRILSIQVYQELKDHAAFSREGSYIFVRLSAFEFLEDKLISAFSAKGTALFIVECDQFFSLKQAEALKEKIAPVLRRTSKQLILISGVKHHLINIFAPEEVFQEQSKYEDLDDATQKRLSEKPVLFCGNQMTLGDLVSAGNYSNCIDSDALQILMQQETVDLGGEAVDPDALDPCFRPRKLKRSVVLAKEVLKNTSTDMYVVLEQDSESMTQDLEEGKKFIPYDQLGDNAEPDSPYITFGDNTENEFINLAKRYPNRRLHWLEIKKDKLCWVRSRGSLTEIRKFIRVDDTTETPMDEVEDNVLVVSAEPGMGKTLSLQQKVAGMQQENPCDFIFYIDLKKHKNQLQNRELNSMVAVILFLAESLSLTALGAKLLKEQFHSGFVQLYFDSFDEISSDHQSVVISMAKVLQKRQGHVRFWIATRKHMQQSLEDSLEVFGFAMRPFGLEDQIDYLKDLWARRFNINLGVVQNAKRCHIFAEAIVERFSNSLNGSSLAFMGVPLRARLFAEAFAIELKEYLECDEDEVYLPDSVDIVDLYERFVQGKYEIFYSEREKGIDVRYRPLMAQAFMQSHQVLAAEQLFSENAKEWISEKNTLTVANEELFRVGLIESDGEQVTFTHRTFAEFFAAKWLVSLLVNPERMTKAIEFFQSQILKSRYQVVRIFAECLVKKTEAARVIRAWQSIADSIICEPREKDSTVLRIAYDQEEDSDEEEEEEDKPFSEVIESLSVLSGRVVRNKVHEVLDPFFEGFLKARDRIELENALSKLADLAHATSFNILKRVIMWNIDEAIKHYLIQVFSGSGSGAIDFDMQLIARFASVKGNTYTTGLGQHVGESVDEVVSKWKKRAAVYEKLKAGKMRVSDKSFWNNFGIEKMLFLRATVSTIKADQIGLLLELYKQDDVYEDFHDVLDDLLLQVEERGAALVLQHFVEKRNGFMIKRICDKFIHLKLPRAYLEKIYQENIDLFWLERTGIVLSLALRQLSIDMVRSFNSILNPKDQNTINGFHTGYARNIFDGYLLPMLDVCRTSKAPYVDSFSFLIMFVRFSRFYKENGLVERITPRQMVTILRLLQRNINHPLVSVDRLEQSLQMLAQLVDIFQFALVRVGDNLLVQDPLHDFSFLMGFQGSPEIISILSRLVRDSESNIFSDCSKVVGHINSKEQQKLVPQFAQTASYQRLKNKSEAPAARKRSNSFNF